MQSDLEQDEIMAQIEAKEAAEIRHKRSALPVAITTPIDNGLQECVLKTCPQRINTIIATWAKIKEIDTNRLAEYYEKINKRWIFVGPPGTGKSTLGKAIAGACGIPYYFYRASSLANEYKNSGTQNLAKIFAMLAKSNKPCVLIIDELEVLVQQHKNRNDLESGMLTEFWSLTDCYKDKPILCIATVNDFSKAPSQIRDRYKSFTIEVACPDENQRKEIILYYMQKFCGMTDETQAQRLAAMTNEASSRGLEDLIRRAAETYLPNYPQEIHPTEKDYQVALQSLERESRVIKFFNRCHSLVKEYNAEIMMGVGLIGISCTIYGSYANSKQHKENVELQKKLHGESMNQNATFHRDSSNQQNRLHQETMNQQQVFHKEQNNEAWWSRIGSSIVGGASVVVTAVSAALAYFKKA